MIIFRSNRFSNRNRRYSQHKRFRAHHRPISITFRGRYRRTNPDHDISKETDQQTKSIKLPRGNEKRHNEAGPQVKAYFVDVPMNIDENKVAVLISLDVPGIKLSDLHVEYNDGMLHVSGERSNQFGYKTAFDQVAPIDRGRIDVTNVTADLSNGVLKITLPKKETVETRVIPILINPQSGEKSTKELENLNEKNEEVEEPDITINANEYVDVTSEGDGENMETKKDRVTVETVDDIAKEKTVED